MPKNMFLNLTFTSLQNVTKGARHKIVISIQKLKERQNLLKSLERVSYHQVMGHFYLHGRKMGQGKLYSQLQVSSAGLTESNRLFPYHSQKKWNGFEVHLLVIHASTEPDRLSVPKPWVQAPGDWPSRSSQEMFYIHSFLPFIHL